MTFHGSLTALATPFRNGQVDDSAYAALCDWQIKEGTSGLVPCGTTGESVTLTQAEHERVVSIAIETAKGRAKVLAGAGSNSTAHAISLAKFAQKAGADGVLVVCPYYNKPTQEGLYQHFKAVAASIDIPVILYNVPGRTVSDLSVETMKRLRDIKNIIGVKDATANLARVTEQRLACGEDFIQLSGEDATALAFNAHGGVGCVSVTSNVAPRLCADMHAACKAGDYAGALKIQDRLMPLHRAMFAETSPAPVKYALSLLGKGSDELRLPLVSATEATKVQVRDALVSAGLLH